MRSRTWTEHQSVRAISTGEGPMPVYKGEVVIVIAVPSYYEAGQVLAILDKAEPEQAK